MDKEERRQAKLQIIWSRKPVSQIKSEVLAWAEKHDVTNDTIRATSELAMTQFAWFVSDHQHMTPKEAVENFNIGQPWGLRVDYRG